ncbi:MAG TPA: ABC transporter ATP-binding protein [Desulfobacterales bacterium]|nr:ABC transporter ATP-binding protein [Desulfobacterales bacterium]
MSVRAIAQLDGVTKNYLLEGETVSVLRGVNFSVYQNEFIAIMGSSGSGKSTLLHILGCLDTVSEGTYELNGRNVSGLADEKLAALRLDYIGFVFQDFNLLPHATVFENVALPFLYSHTDPDQSRIKVMEALDAVGLAHRIKHRPSALSGGERQRVAIARAVVCKPKLILADEPTGNLDSVTSSEILALFGRLHKNGATIVLVTHDHEVAKTATRTMFMKDGQLAGTP